MTAVATVLAGLTTGLVAGVYLAFSVMVMPALARTPPAPALAVMQRINALALRPVFMTVFIGAAATSVWVLLAQWLPGGARDGRATAGAVLSLISFGITAAVHVPRNLRIAALDGGSTVDLDIWHVISAQWRWGNHLRATCAALGLGAFLG